MSNQLIITVNVGTPPYDVYVCDVTNTYCYLVSGNTYFTTYAFEVPPPLNNVESLLLKLIDANNCERFILVNCMYFAIVENLFEDGSTFLFEDGSEFIFEG
jgi:hypothetical protein